MCIRCAHACRQVGTLLHLRLGRSLTYADLPIRVYPRTKIDSRLVHMQPAPVRRGKASPYKGMATLLRERHAENHAACDVRAC